MTSHVTPKTPATRGEVLALLSTLERATLLALPGSIPLQRGEEYLDLERLDHGVRRALGVTATMGRLLACRAVDSSTWAQILFLLAARRGLARTLL